MGKFSNEKKTEICIYYTASKNCDIGICAFNFQTSRKMIRKILKEGILDKNICSIELAELIVRRYKENISNPISINLKSYSLRNNKLTEEIDKLLEMRMQLE